MPGSTSPAPTWSSARRPGRRPRPRSPARPRPRCLAPILGAAPRPRTGPGPDGGRVGAGPATDHLEKNEPNHRCRRRCRRHAPQDGRRRRSTWQLRRTPPKQLRWRATVAARLPSQQWPERGMLITAVDARQVNRSCSTATAGPTGGRRRRQHSERRRLQHRQRPVHRRRLPSQRERRSGSRVRAGAGAVSPRRPNTASAGLGDAPCRAGRRAARGRQRGRDDPAGSGSLKAFGTNLMDPSTRPPAARAGYGAGQAGRAAHGDSGAGPRDDQRGD